VLLTFDCVHVAYHIQLAYQNAYVGPRQVADEHAGREVSLVARILRILVSKPPFRSSSAHQ
jgi:hypothetical protein